MSDFKMAILFAAIIMAPHLTRNTAKWSAIGLVSAVLIGQVLL